PKIIAEGWSIDTLKERAGRAQRPLASAFFDTNGCSGCPHNTQAQAGLFDAIGAEAMCSDAACYRKKTDDAVAVRRAELEETYGKVILLSEVADDQRSTVSAAVVGDTQFTQCQQCQSRAVVMDNRAGREGQITENQCLDKACFTKCAKAKSAAATKAAAKAPAATPPATKAAAASATKSAAKPVAAAEAPAAPAKVSATLVEMYRQILRDTAAKHLLTIPSYRPALVIASLAQTMQCEVEPLASRSATFGLADKIKVLMGHDLPTLQTLLNEAVTHLSTTVATPTGSHIGHMIDVLIAVFKVQPEAVALATAAWKPTNEILSQYTKDGLVALLNDAGFAAAYDAAKGTAAFAKLQNGDKKSFVKAVMAFTEFDWSPYAPEAGYLASLR
ncbi:MAG: hypothetical protein KA754_06710, partial [Corallincola sp.]|nr:hypothetical protein [Corallincola sp.]